MTIKILPARLANQIAAGEVVERPASVVKELVENSLDSGATRIDVDIEKGGAKLIRVRDNGHGIPKDELTLALSRHATSKIHTLDDLEAIMSLGFRGEALASISSVSRLMMTSRPDTQEEAWMAYSEGRDMSVQLQPAAHPVGTTVEVLDLFFNTPARRKFLRTEKTEFTHIDDVLKRIALSRFDVTICLRHNGKIVRQYRAATTELQQEKRLAAVCGQGFVRHLLKIELEHQGLSLHGWITTPEGARQQNDLQYCYVNGRMMKDKLINHAIRQSYEAGLSAEQYAAYVLYICLEPHQVDVNVHPAKHEVRFHQARLVHDFIYQALTSALAEGQHIQTPELNQAAFHQATEDHDTRSPEKLSPQILDAIQRTPSYPGRAEAERDDMVKSDIVKPEITSPEIPKSEPAKPGTYSSSSVREPTTTWGNSSHQPRGHQYSAVKEHHQQSPSSQEVDIYQQLMQVDGNERGAGAPMMQPNMAAAKVTVLGKALAIIQGQYLLMHTESSCCLVALNQANLLKVRRQLDAIPIPLKGQPLLVPLSVKVSTENFQSAEKFQSILQQLGIDLKFKRPETLMVMSVPQPLRRQNLQRLIPDLVSYTTCLDPKEQHEHLKLMTNWLAERVSLARSDYTLSEAIQLIAEIEQLFQGELPLNNPHLVQLVDFSATMTALHS